MKLKELIDILKQYPDNFDVDLYTDAETDGIAIEDPSKNYPGYERVIEL